MSAQIAKQKSGFLHWLQSLAQHKKKEQVQKPRVPTDEYIQFQEEIEKLKKATKEFRELEIWNKDMEQQARTFCHDNNIDVPEFL